MAKQPIKKKIAAPKGAELKLESRGKLKGDAVKASFYNSVGGERTVSSIVRKVKEGAKADVRELKVKNAMNVGRNPQPVVSKPKKPIDLNPTTRAHTARKTARIEAARKLMKK